MGPNFDFYHGAEDLELRVHIQGCEPLLVPSLRAAGTLDLQGR
jgi:hypothetical protein